MHINEHQPPQEQYTALSQVVDRMVEIHTELEGYETLMEEYDELKKFVKDLMAHRDPEEALILHGTKGDVYLNKCRVEHQVTDKKKLLRMLGRTLFDQLATFSITDLRKFLGQQQIDTVTTPYYGPRSVYKVTTRPRAMH